MLEPAVPGRANRRRSACRSLTAARAALFALACVATPVAGAPAAPLVPSLQERWRWAQFTAASGLPTHRVDLIVETRDQTPWVRTSAGIAWYDGFRWNRVGPAAGLPDAPVRAMVAVGSGDVAITSEGRVFVGNQRGFSAWPSIVDGRTMTVATAVAHPGGQGLLALSSDGRLYSMDGAGIRPEPTGTGLESPVLNVWQTGASATWLETAQGLHRWRDGRWVRAIPSRPGRRPVTLGALASCGAGDDWVLTQGPGSPAAAWHVPPEGRPVREPVVNSRRVAAIGCTVENEVIAAQDNGDVFTRQKGAWHRLEPVPQGLENIVLLQARPNGDLWVATEEGLFLHRRSSSRWTQWDLSGPGARNTVNAVVRTADGTLAIGGDAGAEFRYADGSVERIESVQGRRVIGVTGIGQDAQGQFWATSGSGFTGALVGGPSRWRWFEGDQLMRAANFHRVFVDHRRQLWLVGWIEDSERARALGSSGAVAVVVGEDGRPRFWEPMKAVTASKAYAFGETSDGTVWIGTDTGLWAWKGGAWRLWNRRQGFRTDRVFTLTVDRSDRIWFADQFMGLGRLDGGAVTYQTTADGLISDAVWEVTTDAQDRIWVSSWGGVCRLDQSTWTCFSQASGLESTKLWPLLPLDDRVMIGTFGAGVRILAFEGGATPPPRVFSKQPVVDNDVALVRWAVASYWGSTVEGAIQSRYRLDSNDWAPWTTAREVTLHGLAPGPHVVQLQARDPFGRFDSVGSSVTLRVAAPLMRRPLFWVPVTSLALAVFALAAFIGVSRRRHDRALRDSEQRLRTFMSNAPLVLFALDADGIFTLSRGRGLESLGLTPDQVVGQSAFDVYAGAPEIVAAIRRTLAGETIRAVVELADTFWDTRYAPITAGAGTVTGLIGVALDVTEQVRTERALRRSEERFRQAQKMEGVGRLAGGVAHDFNNLLTVILGNAEILELHLAAGDPRREPVEQLRIAGERAGRLTKQLLAFARRQMTEPRVLNLNEVVLGVDQMLRRLIGEDIEMVTITAPDLAPVKADPGQIEQVLVNLAVNARDAMRSGGTLTIETSNVTLSRQQADAMGEILPGPHVRLSVSDTGVGMDAETQAHLFEPFFTTKEPGKGTGLGLATCYGIVTQSGGVIRTTSEVGKGSRFEVFLPRTSEAPPAESGAEAAAHVPGGQETVLVVEDEPQLRSLASQVLRARGYNVLDAPNGLDAVELAARYLGRIDLLVCDMVMPRMGGTEAARRIRAGRPDLRVLFVSGYTDDVAVRREVMAGRTAFLAKPFTPNQLGHKVRELLDAAAS